MTPGGDKNGADINLALDALEMAFTHDHINAFVIVGGDSDFITLVEKLKQYDKKVFVVGGRAVHQPGDAEELHRVHRLREHRRRQRTAAPAARAARARAERGRRHRRCRSTRRCRSCKRALKVLADREVSPQLGLLKSTLLQLDSSFSERDYGVRARSATSPRSSRSGFVTLKHNGRSTLVELTDAGSQRPMRTASAPAARARSVPRRVPSARRRLRPRRADDARPRRRPPELALAEGVELVRAVLADRRSRRAGRCTCARSNSSSAPRSPTSTSAGTGRCST